MRTLLALRVGSWAEPGTSHSLPAMHRCGEARFRGLTSAPRFARAYSHNLLSNFAKPRSGHALPDSHTAGRIRNSALCVILSQKPRRTFMNDWNNAEWFVEWLKLARNNEGNLEG